MLITDADLTGLPILPYLYHSPSNPLTATTVTREAARLKARADKAHLSGTCTQAGYEHWVSTLDAWSRKWLAEARARD